MTKSPTMGMVGLLGTLEGKDGLFERVCDRGEGRVQVRPEGLDNYDDRDGDAGRYQTVLDRGRARIVPHELAKQLHSSRLLAATPFAACENPPGIPRRGTLPKGRCQLFSDVSKMRTEQPFPASGN